MDQRPHQDVAFVMDRTTRGSEQTDQKNQTEKQRKWKHLHTVDLRPTVVYGWSFEREIVVFDRFATS